MSFPACPDPCPAPTLAEDDDVGLAAGAETAPPAALLLLALRGEISAGLTALLPAPLLDGVKPAPGPAPRGCSALPAATGGYAPGPGGWGWEIG